VKNLLVAARKVGTTQRTHSRKHGTRPRVELSASGQLRSVAFEKENQAAASGGA
jgi:hypothetical protein